jgi:hypothetical protein
VDKEDIPGMPQKEKILRMISSMRVWKDSEVTAVA